MIFEHILENSEIKNVFITGDFNSEPNSNVIKMFYFNKFLEEQKISNDFNIENFIDIKMLRKLEKIHNIFFFQSAYQSYSKIKQIENEYMKHPKFTSRTKFFKRTIDSDFAAELIFSLTCFSDIPIIGEITCAILSGLSASSL